MNVLIYIPEFSRRFGGVYQYTIGLLRSLGSSVHHYYIYCWHPDDDLKNLTGLFRNIHLVHPDLINRNRYNRARYFIIRVLNKIWFTFFRKTFSNRDFLFDIILKKYQIDITHSPYMDMLKRDNIPAITTIHDVQELHFPAFFDSKQRAWRAVNNKKFIDESDAVIVSYEHIRNDIISFFDKNPAKVFVCLLDMQNLWFERFLLHPPDVPISNLPEKFIFYPSVLWEHKNHIALLRSLAYLRNEKQLNIHLVCTGNDTIPFASKVRAEIINLNLSEQVTLMGVVSDEVLFTLYRKTRATVIPTLYEAGSFPLMESILMERPVICSNVTSLPETIGDDRFVFNPLDIQDMAQKIEMIFNDENFRKDNIERLRLQQDRLRHTGIVSKLEGIYASLTKESMHQKSTRRTNM